MQARKGLIARELDPLSLIIAVDNRQILYWSGSFRLGVHRHGNKEQAFIWLEKGYSQHASLTTLKVDPIYDPLRGDPRFQNLLHGVGLDQ